MSGILERKLIGAGVWTCGCRVGGRTEVHLEGSLQVVQRCQRSGGLFTSTRGRAILPGSDPSLPGTSGSSLRPGGCFLGPRVPHPPSCSWPQGSHGQVSCVLVLLQHGWGDIASGRHGSSLVTSTGLHMSGCRRGPVDQTSLSRNMARGPGRRYWREEGPHQLRPFSDQVADSVGPAASVHLHLDCHQLLGGLRLLRAEMDPKRRSHERRAGSGRGRESPQNSWASVVIFTKSQPWPRHPKLTPISSLAPGSASLLMSKRSSAHCHHLLDLGSLHAMVLPGSRQRGRHCHSHLSAAVPP